MKERHMLTRNKAERLKPKVQSDRRAWEMEQKENKESV